MFPLKNFLFAAAVLAGVGSLSAQEESFPLEEVSKKRKEGVVAGEMLKFKWENSKIFPGTEREVRVYVPRAYDGKTPACTAVFQDGGGYRFETVFDNLIHSGEMPVTVAVVVPPGRVRGAIEPDGMRYNRTFEYDSPGDRYARFLLEEILPEVEKQTTSDGRRIKLSKEGRDRMIAGGSSGAAAAFNAAWAMPEEFSRVFSAVGSYTGLRGSYIYPTLIHKTEPKAIRLFLQSGTRDMWTSFGDWWSANNAMVRALEFAGYEFDYEFGDGKHSTKHGTALFPRAMRFLWKDWPAPVKASASSRNHALKAAVAGQGWEFVDESSGQRVRADKDGSLFTSGWYEYSTGTMGFPDRRTMKTFKRLADGTWMPVEEGMLLCFDKDGEGKIMMRMYPRKFRTTDKTGKVVERTHVDFHGMESTKLEIERVAPNGEKTLLTKFDETRRTEAWSFAAVSSGGDVYAVGGGGKIFLLRGNAETPKAVLHGRSLSSGISRLIAISGDGNWLAEFETNTTRGWSWRIEKDGSLSCRQSFYVLHKRDEDDGAGAMDAAAEVSDLGYMYVATALGVQVCDANGRTAAILPLPRGVAAVSLCFGGKDFKTLFVLGADGKIYSRKMKNRGAVPWLPPDPIRMKAG